MSRSGSKHSHKRKKKRRKKNTHHNPLVALKLELGCSLLGSGRRGRRGGGSGLLGDGLDNAGLVVGITVLGLHLLCDLAKTGCDTFSLGVDLREEGGRNVGLGRGRVKLSGSGGRRGRRRSTGRRRRGA